MGSGRVPTLARGQAGLDHLEEQGDAGRLSSASGTEERELSLGEGLADLEYLVFAEHNGRCKPNRLRRFFSWRSHRPPSFMKRPGVWAFLPTRNDVTETTTTGRMNQGP